MPSSAARASVKALANMDTFKFACPVCGQHISVEPNQTGSQMECPTCFQKIVVPQAPSDPNSKFILTAAKFQERRTPMVPGAAEFRTAKNKFPLAAIGFFVILAAAVATGFVFRDRI